MGNSKKQKSGRGRLRRRRHQRQQKRYKVIKWLTSIGRTWSVVVGISVLMTIVGTVYALSPKVSVASYNTLDPSDPFSTPFIISNDSTLQIHDVTLRCKVENLEGMEIKRENDECNSCPDISLTGFGTEETPPISVMESGERTTLLCSGMNLEAPDTTIGTSSTTSAEVVITVKYRPDWIFWSQERQFRFGTAMNTNGQLIWIPMPNKMPIDATPTRTPLIPTSSTHAS